MPGDYPRGNPEGNPGASWKRRQAPQSPQSPQQPPRGPASRPGGPMGAPGASGRRPAYPPPDRSGMYRPSSQPGPSGSQRMPGPYRGPGGPGAPGRPGASGYGQRAPVPYGAPRGLDPFAASHAGDLQVSARLETIQRKRNGFAFFHDGNAGHLWRGEVASLMGESILSAGMVIWLAYLTSSPVMVLFGVLALGLPWLILTPLAPWFENIKEPGWLLAWLGRARVVAALGVVAMHFYTLYPLLYLLLFVVGLTGRARQALRVAATRVCLEPGEVELVANDLFTGSALVTVVGPLLASALFMALGERIILVGLAAAACFLLASNSDGFLDALPEERRAFTHANPTTASPDERTRASLIAAARQFGADADAAEDEETASANLTPAQRERALPEWFQQGPTNAIQAMADVRAGLGLAGASRAGATALLSLVALAVVSGGLSVLEVFYVTDRMGLASYYVGALIALEAGGVTLGAMLADLPGVRRLNAGYALLGLGLTGFALVALSLATIISNSQLWITMLLVSILILGMGVTSGMAVMAARRTMRADHDGVERRAISAGEVFITTLASGLGAILFTFAFAGYPQARIGTHILFPGLPIGLLLAGAGVALMAAAAVLLVAPGLKDRAPKSARISKTRAARDLSAKMASLPGASGRFAKPDGAKSKKARKGKKGAAGSEAVGSLWDDHPDEDDGGYDDYTDEHSSAYGDDDDREDDLDAEEEDWDGPPRGRGAPRHGGRAPANPRINPRDRRGRW